MPEEPIVLAEASPDELKKIQHSAVRALALSLGAGGATAELEDELIHLSIIISGFHGGGGFPDRDPA
jgi:hypothetical protein